MKEKIKRKKEFDYKNLYLGIVALWDKEGNDLTKNHIGKSYISVLEKVDWISYLDLKSNEFCYNKSLLEVKDRFNSSTVEILKKLEDEKLNNYSKSKC